MTDTLRSRATPAAVWAVTTLTDLVPPADATLMGLVTQAADLALTLMDLETPVVTHTVPQTPLAGWVMTATGPASMGSTTRKVEVSNLY